MKPTIRKKLWVLLWLFPLLLVWWVWRDIPFDYVSGIFSRIKVWQIALLILINTGITVLFSMRWWILLNSDGFRVPYFSLVLYRLAGFSLSYFTPGPQFGGEPLQVHLVHRRQHVPLDVAVATVSLDKLIELLANFSFLAFGILMIAEKRFLAYDQYGQLIAGVLFLFTLPVVYLVALWRGMRPFSALIKRISFLERNKGNGNNLSQLISNAEGQLSCFCQERFRLLFNLYLASLLIWGFSVLEYAMSAQILGYPMEFGQVIVVLTAARLAFLLPVPSGLGTLEVSQVVAFKALGFSPAFGASMALLIRMRDVVFASLGLLVAALLMRANPQKALMPFQVSD